MTQWVTVFLIRANRNRASFDDLVGPKPGILTTDRFPVYTHLKPDKRQICWTNLRRDIQAMIDWDDAGSVVGEDLFAHADMLFEHWQKVRYGTRKRRWFQTRYAGCLREGVRLLLERGTGYCCAQDGRDLPRNPGGGSEPVDVRLGGRRGTDEQRGRAGVASRGLLAENQLRHGQRTG